MLFLPERDAMLYGLKYRADQPGASARTRQVAESLTPYAMRQSLPDGVSEELFRFLAVTAGLGLWDQLDQRDPRIADVLLSYYTTDAVLTDLTGSVPRIGSPEGIGLLVRRGMHWLRAALPNVPTAECPLELASAFPADKLHRRIRVQTVEAARAATQQRWADPARRAQGEEHLRREARLRHARHLGDG